MRKLTVAAFVSLDGVMQAPGGPEEDPTGGFTLGGWTATYWDEVMGAFMGESFANPSDLLLGRKTYEIFAAHWPYTDEEPAAALNSARKYVATTSTAPLTWQNSVALNGDVAAQIAELKTGEGPDLMTQGSSVLIQTLVRAGLVDEYSLMIFPVILGKGKRLFQDGAAPTGLQLISSKASTTGVLMNTYRPAGPVPIGDFQLAEPTPAELARRARMKVEG